MADTLTPDLCVVGGGPAGIATALGAVREGLSVVLVEGATFGGAYHGAAVKTRALASAAGIREVLRQAPGVGISGAPMQVDLAKLRERVEAAATDAAAIASPDRLEALGVSVVRGKARFLDRRRLVVDETPIRPGRVVLAVGARRPLPDVRGISEIGCLTSDRPVDFGQREPTRVAVLGAGPTALEMAQAYQRLGIDATIVAAGQLLGGFDREQADIVADRVRAEGVRLRTGYAIDRAEDRGGGVRLMLSEPGRENSPTTTVDVSHVFIAGGRLPAVDGLGLGEADIDHGPDGIKVDARLRTTNHRVFAIGDCIAGPPTAARAVAQAGAIVQTLLYRRTGRQDSSAAVRTVHTDPAIAAVGLSEDDARARGEKPAVLRTPFAETLQSGIDRSPEGFLKVVLSGSGRVIGATAVGRGALEVLPMWSKAVGRRLDVDGLASLSVPTPSYSEITQLVAGARRQPDLTPAWRRTIIGFLRKIG